MTDEEKAKEYSHETRIKDHNTYQAFSDECISEVQDYEGNYIYFYSRIEKAYLDGLAEGRKEEKKRCLMFFKAETEELEKENAELKEQINQLSNDNHVLKTAFITQEEQIEKIKIENDEKLWLVNHQLEELLKLGKDKGIIKSWYTNGEYHWELAE